MWLSVIHDNLYCRCSNTSVDKIVSKCSFNVVNISRCRQYSILLLISGAAENKSRLCTMWYASVVYEYCC